MFIMVGIVQFSLPEAMLLGVAGTIVQCLWRPRVRPKAIQIAFSACSVALAVLAAHSVFHGPLNKMLGDIDPLLTGIAAVIYFMVNTSLVACVIALTEKKSIPITWYRTYYWILPYHLVFASAAWLIVVVTRQESWHAAAVLFPLVYFVYRSYKMYLDRLEKDKIHVEELAGLHFRTIEALALAIEAKDATTGDHLQRVRVYATEIGKELKLNQQELDALQAASPSARHRQTGRSRTHHLQTGQADTRRVRKNEDPPGCRRGDSRTRQVPLSGSADCAFSP